MTDSLDVVVIGAGVVGLAAGRALARAGREVVVLEAESSIGRHSSSRNSEVIHAGVYYPDDSLKARLCVAGRSMLYRFCDEKAIPHERTGQLIVATDRASRGRLEAIRGQGERNGVTDLRLLSREEARSLEPAVRCTAALLSPSTGIFDSHAFMLALQADIESLGGTVALNSRVTDLRPLDVGFEFRAAGEPIRCRGLVNAAGLWATELAQEILRKSRSSAAPDGAVPKAAFAAKFAKGHYFTYAGKSPFRHLVYPLPADGGLGIHATNDLSGAVRFGPDVTWIDQIDYSFDPARKPVFLASIREYFPDVEAMRLIPGYTGIRPKLHGPAEPAADFLIEGERHHGCAGLVNLCGIESPGLTASLAIGEYVTAHFETRRT